MNRRSFLMTGAVVVSTREKLIPRCQSGRACGAGAFGLY